MRNRELRQYLNMQAERIETVLRENGLHIRVARGVMGARHVVFSLVAAGDDAGLMNRLRKAEETLALRLGRPDVQIRRNGGEIQLLTSLPGKPRPVWLESYRQFLRPDTMFLGLRADAPATPVLLRPAHPNVSHVLVTGKTGSGKTVLLRTMLTSLALGTPVDRAQIVLLDPKGAAFPGIEQLPHITNVVRGRRVDDWAAILTDLVGEMERRDRQGNSLPRIYLFLDELADLLLAGGPGVAEPLTRLTQSGRGAGIHLIAGTQKPTADSIGGLVKFNFSTRLVGSVNSASDAVAASGMSQSGAEKLLGQGDFMVFGPEQLRFQAAQVKDFKALAREISNEASPTGGRQWVYEEEQSSVSRLLRFPSLDRRGGHNRLEFTDEQIRAARAGLSQYQLKTRFNMSGSVAQRLVREYGPEGEVAL